MAGQNPLHNVWTRIAGPPLKVLFLPLIVWVMVSSLAHGQETELVVVPAVAYGLPGFDDNLWTSEIYLSNPTSSRADATIEAILPGYTIPPDNWSSCPWTGPLEFHIEPQSSERYAMGSDLCEAEQAVGAYVFRVTEGMVVSSRMVNHDPEAIASCCPLLEGFGTEVPGIPLEELPNAGAHLLSTLVWNPDRCGPRTFDTYVGFANPFEVEVHVLLELAGDSADPSIDTLPRQLTVPGLSWQQIYLRPPDSADDACRSPRMFDLRIEIDGPFAIYASVVDRSRQDGRVVLPLPIE
jgi:hypothetical protein